MYIETLILTLIFKHSLLTNQSWHGVESCVPSLTNCLHSLIALYAILVSASLHTCPILGIRQLTPSHAHSLSFSLSLSVSQLHYLWFLSLPWHEGSEFIMFLKARRHIFKVSSGSAELPWAWLKVRGQQPPTPVMGCISWKLRLKQNLVCKIIVKECL